ncbi:MAG TPA: hypothetical protein PKE69_04495, partial [Pyrinomonadaceae bacterium]|nr:hypothetical protein [Pyrinomonadaceae bacterium]
EIKKTDENKGETQPETENPKSKIQNPKSLMGDLDNIILMSLRKEPSRRYSSVEQFSEDLHRHLVGLPVLARPVTLVYSASKFIERNRTTVAFATIALVALLAGLSIAVWQAVIARQERERAERRLTEIRKLTNNLVSGWEKGIPETQITSQVRGRIADISSEYLENLANEINNPEILKELAEAHLKLGHEYAWALVNDDKAKASFQKAETIARKLITDNPNDLEAKDLLVRSLYKYDEFFGERDRETSLQNHFERLRLREEIYAAKPNDEKAVASLSNATHNCGWILKLLGRSEESVPYYRRSIELTKQLIALLEPNAKTSEERSKLADLYSTVAMNQTDIGDLSLSLENYRRAATIADTLYRENPENKTFAGQKAATHYDLGLILKKTGDFRGSNEAFRNGLETARNQNLRSADGYLVRKEINFLLDIAENFHELKDDKSALDSLHESFAVWRKYNELEINKGNSRNLNASAYLFYLGGKLLTRMQKNDEARAVFDESEINYKKFFENNPTKSDKRIFAKFYLTLGDFHAGLGVCSFANSPFEGLANQAQYCPSEIKGLPTTNSKSLTEAKKYYENALNILNEMNAKKLLVYEDQENLRIAREKIALCNEKLNGKS